VSWLWSAEANKVPNHGSSSRSGGLEGSKLELMIALCPACDAKVKRTKMVLSDMNPLLLMLWRECHPTGHQQEMFDFQLRENLPEPERSFTAKSCGILSC
jgi:hypothetical protein